MPTTSVIGTIRRAGKRPDVQIGLFLVVLTLVVRLVVILGLRGQLTEDIDGYLGIARQIADGNGFVNPETGQPTAFRPPLYPILLAGWLPFGPAAFGVAVLHVILAAATVVLTFGTGRRLGLSNLRSAIAGGLIACDPLLARYAALPMTETLATFLAVSLLILSFGMKRNQRILQGIAFGLAVLCRPTFWVFGGFAVIVWTVDAWRTRQTGLLTALRNRIPWVTVLTALVVVLPWVIRNAIVIEHPIVMTTHGGYTLLLGNNPVFAEEVVQQPSGTVWGGESLRRWQQSLEDAMRADGVAMEDEIARDRYLKNRAVQFIRAEPVTFLHACWLRFRRFWGMSPPESATDAIGQLWKRITGHEESVTVVQGSVRWSVRIFYGVLFAAALWGGVCIAGRSDWRPVLGLIISLMLVHLVYWSNARMRAPTMPAIALLAASVSWDHKSAFRRKS